MTTPGRRRHRFYRRVLERLNDEAFPFLVGGAYALRHYTGIARETKDMDLFVRPADVERALALLGGDGHATELTDPMWLAKVRSGEDLVDVVFSSGNGTARVDDGWFAHAPGGAVLGVPVRFCPAEESIWSKAYIMERERFDGADVAHLIVACGERLDWRRLLDRFGCDWPVLLAHLVLFRWIYPGEPQAVPGWVLRELWTRFAAEPGVADERLCRGTLLSRRQYRVDVGDWGYRDARLEPEGRMTPEDVARFERQERRARTRS
jgi:hypothetical protein